MPEALTPPDPLDELMDRRAAAGQADPLDGLMDGYVGARKAQMAGTVQQALGTNPDQYATSRRVAKYLGYPTAAVEAMPDLTKQQAQLKEVQQAAGRSAVLERRYSDADFAKLAHDDAVSLSALAGWFDAAKYVFSAPDRPNTLAGDIGAGIQRAGAGAAGVLRAGSEFAAEGAEGLVPGLRMAEQTYTAGGNPLRRLAEGFAKIGVSAEQHAERMSPPQQGVVAGGVSSGVQSTVQNVLALPLALLPGGQPAALTMMTGGAGGQAYQQAREQGLAPAQALPFAVSQGAIEYATEKLPLHKLIGDVAKATPFFQTLARQAALEIPGEQIATILQDMNEWAALPENQDKPFSAYISARPNAAAQTLIATLIGTGGSVTVAKGLENVMGDAAERADARQRAAEESDRMAALFAAAAESKLRERSPETFGELVQEMAAEAGGAPTEVRFDARLLAETLQQSGIEGAELERLLPAVAPQLQEAVATGGEVTVPIGELTHVVGTPLEQVLLQNARVGANEMSQAEAKEAGEQAAKLIQEQAERVLAEAGATQEMQTSAEAVKASVLEQLSTAGRFTAEVNDAYATLVRDFYTAMAGRLGVTPEQFYQRYPLRVQAQGVTGESLQQPAFHGTHVRGIEEFTTDAMGTGEGAQAYGWGLYFAKSKDVAEFYRKSVSETKLRIGGRPLDVTDPAHIAAGALNVNGDRQKAIADLRQSMTAPHLYPEGSIAVYADAVKLLETDAVLPAVEATDGQLYEVEVPEDNDLLDFDAKLKDQPPGVLDKLRKLDPRIVQNYVESAVVVDKAGKVIARRPTLEAARRYIKDENVEGTARVQVNDITGGELQTKMRLMGFGAEGVSRRLFEVGIPGLRFLDADSRGAQAKDEATHNYVIFDDSAVRKTGEFYQGERGTFHPPTLTISLLEKADLSTFLHETGHFFLEVMGDVASQPGAPVQVVNDMQALLDWFGVKDLATWRAMPLTKQRKHHEKFAESFEQYLLEGKAPSAELQPLFQRFRAWMMNVYRSLTEFMAAHDTQLNDEVRGVFDRLLASDEQIKLTEMLRAYAPIFESAEQAGMTPQEWAAYQQQGENASGQALSELASRSIRDMRWTTNARNKALKELQRAAAEKRKAVEAEVKAEVEKMPLYQAMRWLRKGEMVTAEGEEVKAEKGFRLNTAALAEMYPETALDRPDLEKLKGMTAGNGLHPDLVAEMFGYTSGDQLVRTLIEAEPIASVIEGITDQRMLERHGDLATQRGVERAADEAVHNEARGRFIATGLKALADGTNPRAETGKTITTKTKAGKTVQRVQTVNVMVRAARQFAAAIVARRKVRDLSVSRHTAAEARAGRAAQLAMQKNDVQAAIVAQRDQLLNHYSARETGAAIEEVERGLQYLKKFDKASTRKGLPPEYVDQIDKLLERTELRVRTNRALDKRAKLAEWVKSQQDLGIDVELPAAVLEDAQLTNYRELTVEEFRGLVDAIKQIEHLGRLKNKLLAAKDQREFDAIVDDLVKSILENAGDRTADTRTPTTNLGRALQGVRNFGAAHVKAATWARILDGGKDGGPMWELFVRSANAAGDMETTMRAKATVHLAKVMEPLFKAGKLGGKGTYFPSIGRSLNRESVLAIALNVGNEGNLQRLLGGEGWTADQLRPVLDTVTKEEWAAVQAVWDYFETFRPLIAAKERRVFGKEPDWVERGSELAEAYGVKGGYYPIKYDPAASVRAEEHADAEGARRQLQGAYGAATTRRSFTKSRAEEVNGRPLLYTLGGVYGGVNDVIHDLTWHEWLIDTNRLLKSQAVDSAIRSKYGPAAVRQFKTWRDDIAEGDQAPQYALDLASAYLRRTVSIAGLGFNVMSALIQPLGLTQSITRVGAGWIGRGAMQYVAHPVAATREVNEKSEFMANRSRTRFRELNELRNRVQGQSTFKRLVNENAFVLMLRMQQLVDVPTWLGAYEKAIAQGNDEERATALADQAVIDSQGGGQTKDQAAIERGGPTQKLFTVFYIFMNTALNLGVASGMTPKSKAKFVADMLMLYVIPAVLGFALKEAITPGDDDDDDEKLAQKLAAEQLSYLLGMVVLGREFGAAAKVLTGAEDRARDYAGPAGVRAIADVYQFTKQGAQGEFDDAFRKATVNLLGDLFGLPSAQINRTITGAKAIAEGKTANPAALALGYKEAR